MVDHQDQKAALHHYLKAAREDLVWKLDGLSEREVRLPRTPTGTNLLGIVKHCLNVEAGYFGPTFGREFGWPGELVPMTAYDEDPQADWYAREDETKDGLIDRYRRVGEFADQTIEQLPLDTLGQVPWWKPGPVTLQRIIIHVTSDLSRHAGHADILREQLDSSAGLSEDHTSIPDEYDWPSYVTRLTDLADRFH